MFQMKGLFDHQILSETPSTLHISNMETVCHNFSKFSKPKIRQGHPPHTVISQVFKS